MSFTRTTPVLTTETPKRCFGTTALAILITALVIITIILIIVLVLYFSQQSSRIDPNECPEAVQGLVVTPNKAVAFAADNCGNVIDCKYTVNNFQDAADICASLGNEKCVQFSLEQVPASNDFEMTVASDTATIDVVGANVFRTIN